MTADDLIGNDVCLAILEVLQDVHADDSVQFLIDEGVRLFPIQIELQDANIWKVTDLAMKPAHVVRVEVHGNHA